MNTATVNSFATKPTAEPTATHLCMYVNQSPSIQVIRLNPSAVGCLERTVWPGQRLLFEAPLAATLDVYSGQLSHAILADRVPCRELAIADDATFQDAAAA